MSSYVYLYYNQRYFFSITQHWWLLQTFCLSMHRFLSLEAMGYDDDIPFVTVCSQVIHSAYHPIVDTFGNYYLLWEEASCCTLSKALIYGYRNMSLRLILLLCSFNIIIVVAFTTDPWLNLSQVTILFSSIRYRFHLTEYSLNLIKKWLIVYSQNLCSISIPMFPAIRSLL